MTAVVEHPKPRAGRRGFDVGAPSLIEFLISIATICGRCFGYRTVHCPQCCGFNYEMCTHCRRTGMRACPECTSGPDVDAIRW